MSQALFIIAWILGGIWLYYVDKQQTAEALVEAERLEQEEAAMIIEQQLKEEMELILEELVSTEEEEEEEYGLLISVDEYLGIMAEKDQLKQIKKEEWLARCSCELLSSQVEELRRQLHLKKDAEQKDAWSFAS